ncbi:MAG: 6-bladed beta-propeller [Candidatus Cryptobacteroides sp.]
MEEMYRVDEGEFQLKVADMVRYVPDLGILVKSGNDLFLFNEKTNSVTAKFGRLGRAKDEYTFISDFGYDKDAGQVYLYDMNSKRINWYSPAGEFIDTVGVTDQASRKPFSTIVKYGDHYIGKRVFGMPGVPEMSLYDEDFNFVRAISPELLLRSGIDLGKQFTCNEEGEVLYNRYFSNEVLSVTPDSVSVKYIVDFGDYNVPDENFGDEYEIIDYVNSDAVKECATLISNICERGHYLSFAFILKPGRYCLCIYDKTTDKSRTLIVSDPEYEVSQIIPAGDFAFVFFENPAGGSYIGKMKY